MTSPIKKAGFRQGIYDTSSSPLEEVGTLRILKDGSAFRYARAGAALSKGKMCIKKAGVAALEDNVQTGYGASAGSYTLSVVVNAATLVANELQGGYLVFNGAKYEISGNSAITAANLVQVTLKDPLKTAIAATDKITLLHNPWYGTVHSATPANLPAGVALVDVANGYYCWLQTKGIGDTLISGTPALGADLTLATVAGAVGVFDAGTVLTSPLVGRKAYAAGVDGAFGAVDLMID